MTSADDWQAWFDAAAQPRVDAALRDLYQRIDDDIAARSPTCWLSGKCCHFESYGHQLWVTALEIAWLLRQVSAPADVPRDGCPFQRDRLCGIHAIRPLGCRIFFCDPSAQDWQGTVYEAHLDALNALHEELAIAYRYMEWRAGLAEALALKHLIDSV